MSRIMLTIIVCLVAAYLVLMFLVIVLRVIGMLLSR